MFHVDVPCAQCQVEESSRFRAQVRWGMSHKTRREIPAPLEIKAIEYKQGYSITFILTHTELLNADLHSHCKVHLVECLILPCRTTRVDFPLARRVKAQCRSTIAEQTPRYVTTP